MGAVLPTSLSRASFRSGQKEDLGSWSGGIRRDLEPEAGRASLAALHTSSEKADFSGDQSCPEYQGQRGFIPSDTQKLFTKLLSAHAGPYPKM